MARSYSASSRRSIPSAPGTTASFVSVTKLAIESARPPRRKAGCLQSCNHFFSSRVRDYVGALTAILRYDVSGVPAHRVQRVIERDLMHLHRNKGIFDSPAYLTEKGKPVVGLWGSYLLVVAGCAHVISPAQAWASPTVVTLLLSSLLLLPPFDRSHQAEPISSRARLRTGVQAPETRIQARSGGIPG
jgi:hypothetical protein